METKPSATEYTLRSLPWWRQRQFVVMISLAIVASTFLVGIAMNLYNSSGAAQLDLSRPGYKSVRKNVVQDTDVEAFPSTGTIDKAAIDQFTRMYNTRAKSVSGANSFDPGAMSDDALQLFQGQAAAQTP